MSSTSATVPCQVKEVKETSAEGDLLSAAATTSETTNDAQQSVHVSPDEPDAVTTVDSSSGSPGSLVVFQNTVQWPMFIQPAKAAKEEGEKMSNLELELDPHRLTEALKRLGFVKTKMTLKNMYLDTTGYIHATEKQLSLKEGERFSELATSLTDGERTEIGECLQKELQRLQLLLRKGKDGLSLGEWKLPLLYRRRSDSSWDCTWLLLQGDPDTLMRQDRAYQAQKKKRKREEEEEEEEEEVVEEEKREPKETNDLRARLQRTVELFGGSEAVDGVMRYLDWTRRAHRQKSVSAEEEEEEGGEGEGNG